MQMQRVNTSPLHCIHNDCPTIPTIVLEFQHPSGMKIMGQIITCDEHRQEGIKRGYGRFGRNNLSEDRYPGWLQRIHNLVLQNSIVEGRQVTSSDIERLRSFIESRRRSSAEKR